MSKRYEIWNKTEMIVTPTMEIFTPEQWMERFPAARLEGFTVVCSAGKINGGYFGILEQMVQMAESNGCDFTNCETEQDYLDAIEAFEDEMNRPSTEPTAEERQAAALEFIALSSMPDEV